MRNEKASFQMQKKSAQKSNFRYARECMSGKFYIYFYCIRERERNERCVTRTVGSVNVIGLLDLSLFSYHSGK